MAIGEDGGDGIQAPLFDGRAIALPIRDRAGAVIGRPLHYPVACTAWAALLQPCGGYSITHRPTGWGAGRVFSSSALAALAARTLQRFCDNPADASAGQQAAARAFLLDMESAGLCRRQ